MTILYNTTNRDIRKAYKSIKRQYLIKTLEEYESSIEELEYSYQNKLFRMESDLSSQFERKNKCICDLNDYLNHRTSQTIREIRYKQTIFRYKLARPRHRRSSASSRIKTISIYPEAIIETSENLFTDKELDFLSSAGNNKDSFFINLHAYDYSFSLYVGGPSYIRLNQSFLYNKKKSQQHTREEVDKILEQFTSYLHHHHRIPPKSLAIQQLSNRLQTIFYERYKTSLSYLDIYRIRRDQQLMLSIKRKLKDGKYILRVTDKSGVFHIGQKVDYDQKVEKYQQKTGAYIELSSDPLMDTFYKVVRLLNDLNTKNQIKVWQYKKMMPDLQKIKLAYLYFVPKAHKVSYIPSLLLFLSDILVLTRKVLRCDLLFHRSMHRQLVYQKC